MPPPAGVPIFGAVLGHRLVVIADAHLGITPPAVEDRLLAFLDDVPTLGDSLLINGDLFDFWFAYTRVVPRQGIRVVAALAHLRRRVPIVMIGGNHDRWGADFWERELGVMYAPHRTTFEIGRRRVLAVHGDGLTEPHWRARLVHRVINHPVTAAVYRAIHPDLGFWLVDQMSPVLGDGTHKEEQLVRAAARQQAWAAGTFTADPSLDLIIMGHTHRAASATVPPRGHYLNPGAWFDGFSYAIVTETEAELRRFAEPLSREEPPPHS